VTYLHKRYPCLVRSVALAACCFAALSQPVSLTAEEGTPREEKHSCDPWGLGRYDQEQQFAAQRDAYLLTHGDAAYALAPETPVQKVFRDKLWFRGSFGDRVRLSAARNEAEAFQLCVIPLGTNALEGVRVEAGPLGGAAGIQLPAESVRIWQVSYVKTGRPSYPTAHVGYWPDPLVEHRVPVRIDADRLQAFWVRIDVPTGAAPGEYSGQLRVTAQAQPPRNFEIALTVMPFALPQQPVTVFHALCSGIGPYQKYYDLEPGPAREMMANYALRLATDYKLFPARAGAMFYDKQDENFEDFDRFVKPLMDAGLPVCVLPRPRVEKVEGKEQLPDHYRRFIDHLRDKGWFDRCYLYLRDEPPESEYPKLKEDAAQLKSLIPGIRILAGESPHPGLAGAPDAWWSDVSTEDPVFNQECREAGNLVIWYFCRIPVWVDHIYQPIWDSPLMVIDRPGAEQRVVWWLAWKYKMDGIMIWAGNRSWYKDGGTTWPEEPWDPYLTIYNHPYAGADNGNGVLFYPGPDGPLPSIRLELLREGREDYEYLWLLNRLAGDSPAPAIAELLSVPPTVAVTPHMFTRDPRAFYAARRKIAEAIVNLTP